MIYSVGNDASDYFVSHGFGYKSTVREELKAAYKNIIETITHKAEEYVDDSGRAEKMLGGVRNSLQELLNSIRKSLESDYTSWRKRFGKPATEEQLTEFDALAAKIMDGEAFEIKWFNSAKSAFAGRYSNDTVEAISKILKTVRGGAGFDSDGKGPLNKLVGRIKRYKSSIDLYKQATKGDVKTRKVITSFERESRQIDMGRVGDYWSRPHEMAARAFSAYVEDKLKEAGNKSDFLSFGSNNNMPQYILYNVRPFPEGSERKAINAAFDNFVEVLKTKETEKGVALYSRKGGAVEKFKKDLSELVKKDFYSSKSLVIGKTPAVLERLGVENLEVTIHPETIYKAVVGKHSLTINDIAKLPEALERPIMVFDSKTRNDSLVVLTEIKDRNGRSTIAAIKLSSKEKNHHVNSVRSV
jgi:hypothetical protein